VPVPSPPNPQDSMTEEVPEAASVRTSKTDSTRNAYIALGAVVLGIVFFGALSSGNPGSAVVVAIIGLALYMAFVELPKDRSAAGHRSTSGRLQDGRLLLRTGSEQPISEAERSRILEEEVAEYMRDGFFVRTRTATTAQPVKPKKFSFIWALLWLLLFGVGLIVYLIYYAAKRDEGRYVEVDEYGNVKATRQVHHVL
jgi:protein-S-isoprenylcysteine O-methyltransferase Ste14